MFYILIEICARAHCYMLVTVLMCNFSKYLPFINFWGKLHPKICCSPYLLKFSIEIRSNSVNMEKTRWNEICQNFSQFEERQIWDQIYPKNINENNFEKINIKPVIPLNKISVNLKKSRVQEQICPKNMSAKNFGKINIKKVISIQKCTPVRNFS